MLGKKEHKKSSRMDMSESRRLQQLPYLRVETRWILSNLFLGDGRLIRVSAAIRNPLNNLGEHILGDTKARLLGINEGIFASEELLDGWSLRRIAVQALAERALQAWGNPHIADAVVGELDCVFAVDDGEDAAHLVGDVREGWLPVYHLVQDASQTPDVAWFAELHILWSLAVCELSSCAAGAVFETFGRHVVWSADMGVAVDVDGVVCLDGVCDTEVDELEGALDKDKVCGFEVGMHNVMVVDSTDAGKHFFPVVAREAEVELSIYAIELETDDAGEVRFSKFQQLAKLARLYYQDVAVHSLRHTRSKHTTCKICRSLSSSQSYNRTTLSTFLSFSNRSISPL